MAWRLGRTLVPVICAVATGCGGSNSGGSSSGDTTPSATDGEDASGDLMPASESEPPPVFVTDVSMPSGDLGVSEDLEPGLVVPGVVDPDLRPATGLRVSTSTRCPVVGESFEVMVNAVPLPAEDGTVGEPFDVTASITLTQSFGDGLELLSQGDSAIALRANAADIVALRADFPETGEPADGTDDRPSGQTVYIGGFPVDAPPDVLMRKLVPGGCLLAMRLTEQDFCTTAISRGGSASLGTGDTIVAIEDCAIDAPETLSIIELAADDSS